MRENVRTWLQGASFLSDQTPNSISSPRTCGITTSTKPLNAPAFIEGIAVQSYEPHSNTMAVGVIRLGVFQGDDPVMTRWWSLGRDTTNHPSETRPTAWQIRNCEKKTFSKTMHSYEFLIFGCARSGVEECVERHPQCFKCRRFSHIGYVCAKSARHTPRGGAHELCRWESALLELQKKARVHIDRLPYVQDGQLNLPVWDWPVASLPQCP